MTAVAPKALPSQADCLTAAGLQGQILDSYWSNSAKIAPAVIVRPRSAQEIAAAVKAFVGAKQPFALRSGGHTNWAGSNNIEGGVTIDLSLLNSTIYDTASETAIIGPGCRWKEVYAELHKHGRAVAGGHEGNVSVAGLLLGGGNTFFTARRGWGCDNVVTHEVVLADGGIITVDKENHPELFRALKRGSNNFGVMTQFTMTAIPCDKAWGGMTFFSNNPVVTLYANVGGVEQPPAYDKWLALPEILNTVKMTSVSKTASEYNIPAQMHNIWFTLTFKNDPCILAHASALHDQLVADLAASVPARNFITQCLFQPLPTVFGQKSVAAGGNVMGVERQPHNGILFLATAMVKTPEQEAFAYPRVKAWIDGVREFAKGIEGGLFEWRYLNYADKTQDPLASYGEENVRLLREVAARYDPEGVFQVL